MITNPPESGLNIIKEFEGCRLDCYPDPHTGGSPWTIGWGSTRKANGQPFRPGDRITQKEADNLLIKTCKETYLPGVKRIPYYHEMNENQVGALMSFAYNVGAAFYNSPGFNTISSKLKNKQWDKVPEALMLYVNPGSSVEAGLRRRRKAEGDLWRSAPQKIREKTTPHTPQPPSTIPVLNKTKITANTNTLLKKRPDQSSSLNDFEKVEVEKGKTYSCKEIKEVNDHYYVILSYGAGTWYVYKKHFDLF